MHRCRGRRSIFRRVMHFFGGSKGNETCNYSKRGWCSAAPMLPLPIVAPQPVKWIRRRSSVFTMLILDFRIAGLHKPFISRPHVCFLLSHFSKGYCPQFSSDKDILEWIPFNGKWKFLADYEASCWIWIHSSKVKLNISICNPPKRIQIIMHKGSPKITSSSNLTSIPLWRFDFFSGKIPSVHCHRDHPFHHPRDLWPEESAWQISISRVLPRSRSESTWGHWRLPQEWLIQETLPWENISLF